MKQGIILVPMQIDPRQELIRRWLGEELKVPYTRLEPASADASFRRYFRVWDGHGTRIVMDAPPGKENLGLYLQVSKLLEGCGVHVPHVHASDTGLGFALLEDLGTTHMLTSLGGGADPEQLYGDALDMLATLQLKGDSASLQLPPYDREALMREMRLMPEWFCQRHLGMELEDSERGMLEQAFEWLTAEALAQPLAFVHRDYHSRNLMTLPSRSPGVIDFQDALRGPVAYDLVSLLKDCYVSWPAERAAGWALGYRRRLMDGGAHGRQLARESEAVFLRGFETIGLQRHLKVLGIFARLSWRDGKTGYLADLPLTLDYTLQAARRMPALSALAGFLERVVTELAPANARAIARAMEMSA